MLQESREKSIAEQTMRNRLVAARVGGGQGGGRLMRENRTGLMTRCSKHAETILVGC